MLSSSTSLLLLCSYVLLFSADCAQFSSSVVLTSLQSVDSLSSFFLHDFNQDGFMDLMLLGSTSISYSGIGGCSFNQASFTTLTLSNVMAAVLVNLDGDPVSSSLREWREGRS